MKQYELETGTIGFVSVPEGAYGFSNNLASHQLDYIEDEPYKDGVLKFSSCIIMKEFWGKEVRLLGIFSQLKEEDVKEVMPRTFCSSNGCYLYMNYSGNDFEDEHFDTAIESIHSLAQYLGLNVTQPIFVIFKPKE